MRYLFMLIAAICLPLQIASAQSITEKLGGVKTDFKFYCDSVDMEVTDQVIVVSYKRGSFYNYGPGEIPETYYQEFSYPTYSLEFTCRNEMCIDNLLVTKKTFEAYELKNYFEVLLFDLSDNIIGAFSVPAPLVTSTTNNLTATTELLFCYSLDLTEIPLLLLDRTSTVKIKEVIIVVGSAKELKEK